MFFDIDAFKRALLTQCSWFNLEFREVWSLGPGVFATSVQRHGEYHWTTIFYFDAREVKQRDKESGADYVQSTVQQIMADFTVAQITGYSDEHIRIAYFYDVDILDDLVNLVNLASQLFAKVDNSEIEWLRAALPIALRTENDNHARSRVVQTNSSYPSEGL